MLLRWIGMLFVYVVCSCRWGGERAAAPLCPSPLAPPRWRSDGAPSLVAGAPRMTIPD